MFNEPQAPPAAIPAVTLNPNRLAGDYLLALFTSAARKEFMFIEKLGGVKVYQRRATMWCVPAIEHSPPAGYAWQERGRLRSRCIYSAPKN